MNLTLSTGWSPKSYLVAGVLILALVLGPAAGVASADPDGPNHGCVEHPVGSAEYNEECNTGPAASAAPSTAPAPAVPSTAPAPTVLPNTGGVSLLAISAIVLLVGGGLLVRRVIR